MEMFKILARVSGGITGTREGFVKDGNGRDAVYSSAEDAQLVADRYTKSMNTPYSRAFFSYRVVSSD